MLDAFIAGITHADIRKRLFEEKTLTFSDAFKLALTLHDGHKEAKAYEQASASMGSLNLNATAQAGQQESGEGSVKAIAAGYQALCDNCERRCESGKCPAATSTCYNCNKKGHWESQCRKPRRPRGNRRRRPNNGRYTNATQGDDHLNVLSSQKHVSENNDKVSCTVTPSCLSFSTVPSYVNGRKCETLMNSGSSKGYIHTNVAKELKVRIIPTKAVITLADVDSHSKLYGTC